MIGLMKMNEPLVSVVIPTISSRKKFLERALNSVYGQTYKNIEMVVVNEGLPATVQRNIGIRRSNGEYIAFLDDDDEWLPTKIEKQVKYMQENPNAAICICYSNDRRIGNGKISRPPNMIEHVDLVDGFNLSSTSSYLVRASVLHIMDAEKGYCFDESLLTGHEYDLALRITKEHDIITVPEVLMIQNKSPNQISTNWNNKARSQFIFINKWGNEYKTIHYMKRIALAFLFWAGNLFGDRIMIPINFMKDLHE